MERKHWERLFELLRRFDSKTARPHVIAVDVVAELGRQHWCPAGAHYEPFVGVSERGICDECHERLVDQDREDEAVAFARDAANERRAEEAAARAAGEYES